MYRSLLFSRTYRAHVQRHYGSLTRQVLNDFEAVVGAHAVVTSLAKCEQHGKDESYHSCKPPAVVVYPENTEQVSKIVKTCAANRLPIIPFGTGTGLEGGVSAQHAQSVCIDFSLMKTVNEPNVDDFDVTVEAGVTRLELNRILKATGLYFPIDPGADASLCGMCATGASGTMAVRYGTMRQNVLNLTVVLPDGRIVDTAGPGKRARKSSAGYNLTSLFVGSEGTLGVITKATLRLHPVPQHTAVSICQFPNTLSAVNAAVDVMKNAIPVARIEFLDEMAIRASNNYSKLSQKELPMLLFEVHTSCDTHSEEQIAMIAEVCEMHEGEATAGPNDVEGRNKLWKARHDALYAAQALRPNSKCFITDVCVPISRLPVVLDDAKRWLGEYSLVGTIIGHVGDGNFHVLIPLVDYASEVPIVKEYADRLGRRAIEVGGTCTGEHGIGLGKRHLLLEEVGPDGVGLMQTLKNAIDPHCLMNPGKILQIT